MKMKWKLLAAAVLVTILAACESSQNQPSPMSNDGGKTLIGKSFVFKFDRNLRNPADFAYLTEKYPNLKQRFQEWLSKHTGQSQSPSVTPQQLRGCEGRNDFQIATLGSIGRLISALTNVTCDEVVSELTIALRLENTFTGGVTYAPPFFDFLVQSGRAQTSFATYNSSQVYCAIAVITAVALDGEVAEGTETTCTE